MSRLRPLLAGVLVVCVGGLAGCGDDAAPEDAADPASSSSAPAPSGSPVEFRVVLASSLVAAPDSQVLQQFKNLDCEAAPVVAPPEEPTAACDADGVRYALEPASIVGGIEAASAVVPENQVGWVVDVRLDAEAAEELADVSAELLATGGQFALVLEGRVVTAPTMQSRITDGHLQISGDFSEEQAQALAGRLAAG